MKKSWLGYGLFATLAVAFVLLWVTLGDPVGAIVSLVVLVLGIGLLIAIVGYFFGH